jgi:hypothetical protein
VKGDWRSAAVERCLPAVAGRGRPAGTWWGEAPERPEGFNRGAVLNRFAWPDYSSTLAKPWFYGPFSLLSAAASQTRGSANFRTKASLGFLDRFLALVVLIGHSGASPYRSPTESADGRAG